MSLGGKSFRNTLVLVSIVLIISTLITAGVVACEALIKNVGGNSEPTNLKDVDSSQANGYLYANSEQANYESVANCQKTNYKAVSDCQKTECNSFADKSSNPTNSIGTSSSTNNDCTSSSTNSNCTPSDTNSNCKSSSTCYSTSCSKACNGASSTTGCHKSCTKTCNSTFCSKTCNDTSSSTCCRSSCSKTCNSSCSSTCCRTSCSKSCNGSSSNTSSSNTSSSSSVYISGFYVGGPDETPNEEWVQVSNQGTTEVNMEGWTITDEGTKHTYTFPYYVLNSSSTVTLYTGIGTDNGNILFWNSGSFIWNNEGDIAYLYNDQGQLVSTKTGTASTTATAAFATASTASATASIASDTTSQTTTPTITWGNPSDITIGTALNGTQLNAAASVPGNFTYNPAEGTVLSIGTQTLHVDFTPTDTVNYTTASKDVTIIVLATTSNAAKTESTTYTTATPALNGTQLNSVVSVPCNCTYSRAAGNFSAERPWKSRADFMPTDAANYTTTAPENVTINGFSGTQRISSDHPKNRNINSYNSNNQNGSYDQSSDIEFRKGRMWKTYQ